MFGVPGIKCVGGTASAYLAVIWVTANTLRLRSPIEPTECVSGTLPEGLEGGQPEAGSRIMPRARRSNRHLGVIAAKLIAARQGKIRRLIIPSPPSRKSLAELVDAERLAFRGFTMARGRVARGPGAPSSP